MSSKRKGPHRIRAHANPFSDLEIPCPISPDHIDWSEFYPAYFSKKVEGEEEKADQPKKSVEIADVGCGFGGLSVSLADMFPETLILAMEIRGRVVQIVQERIQKLRSENEGGKYQNVACVRVNAMKQLPNWFKKGQLQKIFFLFPDPHFKKKKQRRRIITTTLLAEYAYVLAIGGIAYTNTDVEELHHWMVTHFTAHPLFERIPDEELAQDPIFPLIMEKSEESMKVAKNQGSKFPAAFRRIACREELQSS